MKTIYINKNKYMPTSQAYRLHNFYLTDVHDYARQRLFIIVVFVLCSFVPGSTWLILLCVYCSGILLPVDPLEGMKLLHVFSKRDSGWGSSPFCLEMHFWTMCPYITMPAFYDSAFCIKSSDNSFNLIPCNSIILVIDPSRDLLRVQFFPPPFVVYLCIGIMEPSNGSFLILRFISSISVSFSSLRLFSASL